MLNSGERTRRRTAGPDLPRPATPARFPATPTGTAGGRSSTLAGLAQPFTLSEARRALDTTRRVAVPLLQLLESRRASRRLPDSRRTLLS
ncbi:SelB domain-containing protein [Couchioplanes caeruleus]|uniref:SelB domain-containing protein n=1 Tax=Couchioplanes caeruleus TaxID=56438 RepID=UPI0009FF96BD|nr:SelB C-terminal domain-containing protein [Couchioplanes caeruleus]